MKATGSAYEQQGGGDPAEQRVTSLELFFDLVFVFAIAQVTGLFTNDLDGPLKNSRISGGQRGIILLVEERPGALPSQSRVLLDESQAEASSNLPSSRCASAISASLAMLVTCARAQSSHSGTILASGSGLSLSRATPMPAF